MTELELMRHAKSYIDKLANGIDPLTDKPVSDTDCVNQVRIARCLFYVSGILEKVIGNGGIPERAHHPKKRAFCITKEALEQYPFASGYATVRDITEKINSLAADEQMAKLKISSISKYLLENGYLTETVYPNGQAVKAPTQEGKAIGISLVERTGQRGTYLVTVYSRKAQEFILERIGDIAALNSSSRAGEKKAEMQGKPWSSEEEETLIRLFQQQTPLPQIAEMLKRTESGIQSRLKKLGLAF